MKDKIQPNRKFRELKKMQRTDPKLSGEQIVKKKLDEANMMLKNTD